MEMIKSEIEKLKSEIKGGKTKMTGDELLKKLQEIRNLPCETQTLELKAAEKG